MSFLITAGAMKVFVYEKYKAMSENPRDGVPPTARTIDRGSIWRCFFRPLFRGPQNQVAQHFPEKSDARLVGVAGTDVVESFAGIPKLKVYVLTARWRDDLKRICSLPGLRVKLLGGGIVLALGFSSRAQPESPELECA
jgi:hypothetical protein